MTARVVALSDSLAPWHSFWMRFGQYASHITMPIDITNCSLDISRLGSGDKLFIYRFSSSWDELLPLVKAAKSRGVTIISDIDDYLWQAGGWDRERLRGLTSYLRECDYITCSTQILLEQLAVMLRGPRLLLFPNTAPNIEFGKSAAVVGDPLRIGWCGASWTRPDDLQELKLLTEWLFQSDINFRLVHLGHADGRLSLANALNISEDSVIKLPLCGYKEYVQAMDFDIGLAPLSEKTFNCFKSPIKILEYSSLGIPWIATDCRPYRSLCEKWGYHGRLCQREEDWIENLQSLMDKQTRQSEGEMLRTLCSQHDGFSYGVMRWSSLLSSNHPYQ